jgi:YD repeat-containing protein
MIRILMGMLALAAVPLFAQTPPTPTPTPTQTTTSTERGDENASISARATGQRTAGEAPAPREAQTPATDRIRTPQSPRAPGSAPSTPAAQRQRSATAPKSQGPSATERAAAAGNPDVYLAVPNLSVDQILLEVDNLEVRLELDANVINLVSVKAGVDASIGSVKLDIRGVEAEAYLTVRLDNVARILDRTLTTIDNNPQILEKLLDTVDRTVGTVGNVANTALQPGGVLSQTVNTLGQTVERTLDATGNIVERTLDTTGKLLNEKSVGKLLDLPVLKQSTNAAGQAVKQVRDASGAIIEVTLDTAGKVVNSRVISEAKGGQRP